MSEPGSGTAATGYTVREVVGLFADDAALDAAVKELGLAGVDRAAMSVLGSGQSASGVPSSIFKNARQIADDPAAKRADYVSLDADTEGEAFVVAVPLQIGAFAGAWAVAAAGGALAVAIGATVVGGAIGAGLGGLLCHAVARRHADNMEKQLVTGGLILWVSTPDTEAEERALAIMQRCGGSSVHAHTIVRQWGVADSPLHGVQPDPFLEHDPRAAAVGS